MAIPPFPPSMPAHPRGSDLPVGTVSAYAGAIGPGAGPGAAPIEAWGWMLCDGRALQIAQYPELFAALGYLYGGEGSVFNIPDYRGTFLRGVDNGSGNDPDAAARTAAPGGTQDGVGSTQRSALQDHGHGYEATAQPAGGEPGAAPGGPAVPAAQTTGGPVSTPESGQPVGTSPHETRPANIAINYIIKFTWSLG